MILPGPCPYPEMTFFHAQLTQPRRGAARWGAAVLVAALALTGCDVRGPATPASAAAPALRFNSTDITGASYAQGFSLLDAAGQRRSLQDFRGQVVVVFFGFTQCPDICPTALAEIQAVKASLGAAGAKVRPVFISLDPERDTPEVLKAYVAQFGPDVVALRPSLEELPEAAKSFKVFYRKVEGKTPGSYTMDHTAGSYVFDADGRIRLFARHGSGAQALAQDIGQLLGVSAKQR